MSNDATREFDIVLWGATGFTGVLVAQYLSNHSGIDDVKWAIAGRNQDKLEKVRASLGDRFEDLPILIGDCFDRESLDAIAQKTKVVCTTVGPYANYGRELVAACVEAGTDYCDLTGEAHFVRAMVDEHHEKAQKNGVRIVNCCGFDSIPSDLGTYMVQNEAIKRHGVPCQQVRYLVWKLRGAVSGGTAATVATTIEAALKDKEIGRIVSDPYALNPEGERSGPDESIQQGPRRDEYLGTWTAPFIMAVINEKIVRRSNALLDYRFGKDFRYSEGSRVGPGAPGMVRATAMSAGFGVFGAAMSIKPTRKLLQRFVLPDPGEGPDRESRENAYFEVRLFGRGVDEDGKEFEVVGRVGADSDPGYSATAIMLGESALCLAQENSGEIEGGILTPATAMGDALIERLRTADMTFELE